MLVKLCTHYKKLGVVLITQHRHSAWEIAEEANLCDGKTHSNSWWENTFSFIYMFLRICLYYLFCGLNFLLKVSEFFRKVAHLSWSTKREIFCIQLYPPMSRQVHACEDITYIILRSCYRSKMCTFVMDNRKMNFIFHNQVSKQPLSIRNV